MKSFKNLFALATASLMLFLVGCGGASYDAPPDDFTPAELEAAEQSPGEID